MRAQPGPATRRDLDQGYYRERVRERPVGAIMGVGYDQTSRMSRGEYPMRTTRDDLSIIQGYLGYRADDAGDTPRRLGARHLETLAAAV